jgi:hypothetical protein
LSATVAEHARRGVRFLGAAARLALLGATIGCGSAPCRDGTALVTVNFADALGADAVEIGVTVDATQHVDTRLDGWSGGTTGTVEVRFPSGYPVGRELNIEIIAWKGDVALGSGSASLVAAPGCSAVSVNVVSTAADLALDPADAALDAGDLSGVDAAFTCAGASDGTPCGAASDACHDAPTCAGGLCKPNAIARRHRLRHRLQSLPHAAHLSKGRVRHADRAPRWLSVRHRPVLLPLLRRRRSAPRPGRQLRRLRPALQQRAELRQHRRHAARPVLVLALLLQQRLLVALLRHRPHAGLELLGVRAEQLPVTDGDLPGLRPGRSLRDRQPAFLVSLLSAKKSCKR